MNRNFGIDFFKKIIADVLTFIAARLVTETPHGNARVVFVSFVHSPDSVEVMRSPLDVVAQAVRVVGAVRHGIKAVGFNVGFVNGIKAVKVAHRQKDGVGRIVRGSDGVAVIRFHQLDVGLKVVKAHRVSLCHVGIVMIDAEHLDRLSVEKEHFAVDSDILEADESPDRFDGFAVFFQQNFYFVNIRCFRRPLFYGQRFHCFLSASVKRHIEQSVRRDLNCGIFFENTVKCYRQIISTIGIFLGS